MKQPKSTSSGYGQIFLQRESIGGLILIFVTIAALIIANSGWSTSYFGLLKKEFALNFDEDFILRLSVKHWINDGLMVIFFIVAGLELKREIMVGQLSTWKKAATPLIAALGGMLCPALIYYFLNAGADSAHGWGIPMATDIAYSLGILSLLGKRVPLELKVFLTALAIADDIGAILVIALFYSSEVSWHLLIISSAILVVLFLLNFLGVKRLWIYVTLGIPFWICFLYSGIHPTIAGVLFALSIPIRPVLDRKSLGDETSRHMNTIQSYEESQHILQEETQRNALKGVNNVVKDSIPPLFRMEIALSGFNAFFVLPLFALVNAGVELSVGLGEIIGEAVGLGILLGLFAGKVLGISIFSYISTRLGFSSLPGNLTRRHIIGMGFIAGIGFTMSLFITNLAFEKPEFTQMAKISILLASLLSAIAGTAVLLTGRNRS